MCVFIRTGCRLCLLLLPQLGEAFVIICFVCLFVYFEGTLFTLSHGMVKKLGAGELTLLT